jgi:hypothetical protein
VSGDGHTFTYRADGLLWCDSCRVPSDFCDDEERCSNGCVCNVGDPDVRDRHEQLYRRVYDYDLSVGRVTTVEVLAMALTSAKRELDEEAP